MHDIRLHKYVCFIFTAMIATVATMHAGRASAATLSVTNCHDSGAGSLREAVGLASSGDTVDLRTLSCSRIELTRAITIRQTGLTMLGPGLVALAVDGNAAGRVFTHTGTGTLLLQGMSVVNGRYVGALFARGGCVYSDGNVDLRHVRVHHCAVQGHYAGGGGVWAQSISMYRSTVCDNTLAAGFDGEGAGIGGGEVRVVYSTVSSNVATATGPDYSGVMGGGISAGHLTLDHSRVIGNISRAIQGRAQAGGIESGGITTNYSSISGNSAKNVGGIRVFMGLIRIVNSLVSGNRAADGAAIHVERSLQGRSPEGYTEHYILNSTISGNSGGPTGAIFIGYNNDELESGSNGWISNSTIVFNKSSGMCTGAIYARSLELGSNIIARNLCGNGTENNLDQDVRASGSHNLIGASAAVVPDDTINVDPRLGPLADNGGLTRTHALLFGSPAIDHGANNFDDGFEYDQRGPGYPRTKGAATDIGAFER